MRANLRSSLLILVVLASSQLSACFSDNNKSAMTSLGSFPKSIAFDHEGNAYIATVSGNIIRHDGQQLVTLIQRGDHGLDFAEKIRFSQDKLYIHNKRYTGTEGGYVNEILLYSVEGDYLDHLLSPADIKSKQLTDMVVNEFGQLYSITNIQDVLRINFDKQNLINITPLINIDVLQQGSIDALKQISDLNIADVDPGNFFNTSDTEQNSDTTLTNEANTQDPPVTTLGDYLQLDPQEFGELAEITLPLSGLSNITVDIANNVYLSGLLGVFMFDPDGNYIKTITIADENTVTLTHSLTADPYGNIIVVSYDPNRAYDMQFNKFDRNGNYVGKFLVGNTNDMWSSIQDISFDQAGNFYVVDFVRGVYKFNSQGKFEKTIARPFD